MIRRGLLALAFLAWAPTPALGASVPAEPVAQRAIVGGERISIVDAPWQVDVWSEDGESVSDCGGAILDELTVLTAAHCVEGTTPGNSPTKGGLAVWAGTSSISAKTATTTDRIKLQERRVASARVHPQWRRRVASTGDLAVLTLASPLELDGRRVAAIALPEPLPVPATAPLLVAPALSVTGYGLTSGGAAGTSDGRLRRLAIDVVDPDRCADDDNAIELCAVTRAGSACSGDSGGPVVAPGPVLAGIVSNGPRACPRGGANRYVNLAAPENLAFVLGDNTPPAAPRVAAAPRFVGGTDILRVGQRLTCDGGSFSGDTAQSTAITTTVGTTVLLTAGRTAAVDLTADLVGRRLQCRSYGTSPGGTALSRLLTTTGVVLGAADPSPLAGQCAVQRTGVPITVEAPVAAKAGARIMVTATLEQPSAGSRVALLLVKRVASGSGALRRVQTLRQDASSVRLRLTAQLPRAAKAGQVHRFQVVLATFASRKQALRGTALSGACDAGDDAFSVRIR